MKTRGDKRMSPLFATALALSIIFLIFSHTYITFWSGRTPEHIKTRVREGSPYIFESDEDYFGAFDKIRVTIDYVYILYEGGSIVKVYQHDGTYICTIAISATRGSGGTLMYTDSTKMYLQHANCFYEFEGTEFIRQTDVYQNDEVKEIKKHLKQTSSSGDYRLIWGNLYRQSTGSMPRLFIERDVLHRLIQPKILLPMEAILICMWIIILKHS